MGGRATPVAAGALASLYTLALAGTALASGRASVLVAGFSIAVLAVHLGTAGLLVRRRPGDPVAIALLLTLHLLGVVNAARTLLSGTPPPRGLDRLLFAVSLPVLLVLLAWVPVVILGFFPVRRLERPLLAFAGAVLLAAIPTVWLLPRWLASGNRALWPAVPTAILAADLFVFVYFLSLAFAARRGDVRRRARIVLVAIAAYVGLYVVFRDIPLLVDQRVPLPLALQSLLSLTLPAALVVAVTRYRLFEVDRLIRRSASYAAASLLLVALLLAAVPAVTNVLGDLVPSARGVLTTATIAILLFLLFDPLRRRAQRAIDRRIPPVPADPRRLLAGIVAELGETAEEAPAELVRRISQALRPDRVALWIFPAAGPTRPTTAGALADVPELDRARLLPLLPGDGSGPFLALNEEGGEPPYPAGELPDRLRSAGMVAAVPLLSLKREPLGLLALGAKSDHEPWLPEEQALLRAVVEHAATTLERASLSRAMDEERRIRGEVLGHLSGAGGGALYECELCGRVADESDLVCRQDGHAVKLTLAVPRLLAGRYRLDRRLGQGGMGIVFAGYDEEAARDVAVKLIRADQLRETGALERFRREARLTARLDHPNVVAVFDYGELATGGAFLVMELLTGGSLRAELGSGAPLPFREAAWALDRALDALAAAHAASLVHRDLKPDNLYVSRTPSGARLTVLDFGLARETRRPSGQASDPSSSDTIVGTEGYIAPELLAGRTATPASDLFALGVTGFELLSTRRIRFEKPPTPRELAVDVISTLAATSPQTPAPYARALAAAMNPDPDNRPVSAIALRRSLRRASRKIAEDGDVRFRVLDPPP